MPNSRKKHLVALEELLTVTEIPTTGNVIDGSEFEITAGTWRTLLLKTRYTAGLCHIFECIYNPNAECKDGIGEHTHDINTEVYYQLTGVTTFRDGTTLKPGEIKLIKPGVPHACAMSPDGSCIVIIHPPLSEYIIPKGAGRNNTVAITTKDQHLQINNGESDDRR